MLRFVVLSAILMGGALSAPAPSDMSAPAPADHSIQKRQATTVIGEVARIFDGSPVTLTTVGGVILLLLALDVVFTLLFATAFSGRSRKDYNIPFVGEALEKVYNSVDVVEMALGMMSVEEEACKFKAICMAERAAVRNPFGALAINTINSNLSGLSKYINAVEAGVNGEDCELLYDQCPQYIGF